MSLGGAFYFTATGGTGGGSANLLQVARRCFPTVLAEVVVGLVPLVELVVVVVRESSLFNLAKLYIDWNNS